MSAFFTTALVPAVAWVLLSGQRVPGEITVAAAIGAGLATTVGLGAFLKATSVGTISIVAPISATGVVVPIAIGLARADYPSVLQAVGIVSAVVGVAFAVRSPEGHPSSASESGVGFALLAAVGFGLFYWLMAPASRQSVPWAAMVADAVPVLTCVVAVRIQHTPFGAMREARNIRSVLAAALLGSAGFVLYAFATRHGALPIVSVLACLFPVVTILLARSLLGERVARTQQVAIGAVLTGVVLMTIG